MTKSVWLAASCAASALWIGAAHAQPGVSAGGVDVPPTPHYGTWGFDTAGEDKAIVPGDDFFGFTDGTAVAHIVIPQDRSNYGAFAQLAVLSESPGPCDPGAGGREGGGAAHDLAGEDRRLLSRLHGPGAGR